MRRAIPHNHGKQIVITIRSPKKKKPAKIFTLKNKLICSMTYKAISFGLGPIGASIAKLALKRKDIKIIGAVDVNPSFIGRDLGDVIGLGTKTGVMVRDSAREFYGEADVLLHATSSFLNSVKGQFVEFCENKVDVVSTCEESVVPLVQPRGAGTRAGLACKEERSDATRDGRESGLRDGLYPNNSERRVRERQIAEGHQNT